MRNLILFALIINVIHGAYWWAWMKGQNSLTLGSDPTPPGVMNVGTFQTQNGTIFMFGGYAELGSQSLLHSTLWSYRIIDNHWAIVDGNPQEVNQPSKHRSKDGVERPASRFDFASWIDANEALWIFGGSGIVNGTNSTGIEILDDLWTFTGGQWTQIYPAEGSIMPAARRGMSTWADAYGRLWMYGGTGFNATGTQGDFFDLYYFNITSLSWTLVAGNAGIIDMKPIYYSNSSATPGSRRGSTTWIDSDANLWLFGGVNDMERGDLWMFLPDLKIWRWMAGPDSSMQSGNYGTLGVTFPGSFPGCRRRAMGAIGPDDTMYLFGGEGYGSRDEGYLSDVWKYDDTGQWTWIAGPDTPSDLSYRGPSGESDSYYRPGARNSGNMWISDGVIFIFGGWGYGEAKAGLLNEVWKLTWHQDDVKSDSSKPDYGTFASATLGIAIGIIVLVLGIALVIFIMSRRRRMSNKSVQLRDEHVADVSIELQTSHGEKINCVQ